MRTQTVCTGIVLSATLAACSLINKKGGDAPSGSSAALADNMHDAPTYQHNAQIASALGCNAAGYAKVNAAEGEAFKIDVAVDGPVGSCVHVRWLNGNGGDGGGTSFEMCSDKEPTKTLDVTGQSGGSYLELMEDPPCKSAGVKVSIH
jgi:hypothetical protein